MQKAFIYKIGRSAAQAVLVMVVWFYAAIAFADPKIPTWIATDIEGNLARIQQFLEMALQGDQLMGRIVFNGDLVGLSDRKADLVAMKAFLRLREQHGADKVILIIGNRELQLFSRLDYYKENEPERYEVTYKFLKASRLFYRIDQSLIFHGAFTLDNFRYHPESKFSYQTPQQAINGLEAWYQHIKTSALNGQSEAIKKLVAYGREQEHTPKLNSFSVVYGRYSGETAEQRMPDHEITRFYSAGGISLFINGHTPVGRVPVFMSRDNFGVLVGDTSRSTMYLPEILLHNNELTVSTPYLRSHIGFRWKLGTVTAFGKKGDSGFLIGRSHEDSYYYKAERVSESAKPKFVQHMIKKPALLCQKLFAD